MNIGFGQQVNPIFESVWSKIFQFTHTFLFASIFDCNVYLLYQKALISYFSHQFPGKGRTYAYLTPAILRLIQTCGRVHRSANDKGCIAILDERVTRPSIKKQLPSYFQKEMKIVGSPIECAEQIKKFWHAQILNYALNNIPDLLQTHIQASFNTTQKEVVSSC